MRIDPKELSRIIREKKKRVQTAEPELVDTDYKPDLNPMDMENMKQQGRIEETLGTEHKINAEDTEAKEIDRGGNIGLSPEELKRMDRLRTYFDTLHVSA